MYGRGQMPPMCVGRKRIPSIVEMPKNADMGKGVPEQQIAEDE